MNRAIVLSGGEPPNRRVAARLPSSNVVVIAADSGYRDAATLGLTVDVLVGDLDSIEASDMDDARRRGVLIERHPPEKDSTDLDLAFDTARRSGATHLTLVTGGGGRLDHLLGGVGLLGSPRFADLLIDAWIGTAHVAVAHGPASVAFDATARLVTLLAVNTPAHGITTRGMKYALTGETLNPGETRGVSNEILHGHCEVSLLSGTLLIIRPHALEESP